MNNVQDDSSEQSPGMGYHVCDAEMIHKGGS